MNTWINTPQLAQLAGIARQSMHEVIVRSSKSENYRWRNANLIVDVCQGRGGRKGTFYRTKVASLPLELQLRLQATQTSVKGPLNPSPKALQAAEWWAHFLRPVLMLPKGSRERRAAMELLVGVEVCGSDGQWFAPSLRDVQRKVSRAEAGGIKALMRKRREVKPESRPIITRRWDAATTDLNDDIREAIARRVRQHIRDLWGGGAVYSVVRRLAGEHLAELTSKVGIGGDFAAIMPVCELPKHVIEAGRGASRVHEYATDRKGWDDKRPRVRLTSSGLAPMQLVFGDVHHFDVYVARKDGTLATPKGIAWLDAATRRVWIDIVLCEPKTSVRNEDLIESFIKMTQDPHWGMPAKLYLDNGSEYRFADFLPDALKLAGMDCETFDRSSPLIRATAYNAAAKGILEGSFRVIEQTILSSVPGYIGGDRMNARSANLGKAPSPFDGSFDDFAHDFRGLLAFYNSKRQAGDLAGRSPDEAYSAAVEAGWQRTDVEPLALMTAFSTEVSRKVVDGKITVKDKVYYCDELAQHTGERVIVRVPKYMYWPAVPVMTLKGELIGIARPDPIYSRLDAAGAVEASRRKSVARAAIRAEAADLNPIDVKAEMIASGRRQPKPPVPESKGTIELSGDRAEIGQRIMECPTEQRNREHATKQANVRAALARKERLRGVL